MEKFIVQLKVNKSRRIRKLEKFEGEEIIKNSLVLD